VLRPFAVLIAPTLLGRSRRLHCGCGEVLLEGWINADLQRSPLQLRQGRRPDLFANLARDLPFPKGSLDHIYSNNFLEHLTREEAVSHLQASLRVLVPGGRIRIVVPDIAPYAHAYSAGDSDFFSRLRATSNHWPRWTEPADYLATIVHGSKERGWVHRWAWDSDSLAAVIGEVGFVDVKRYPINESADATLAGVDREPFAVFALEAIKPNPSR
jgi:predicted SAM-dependent methyltransferase